MRLRYDEKADAVYIRLNEQAYAYGEELDPQRRIDYADGGRPIGVELLCVSTGVDLRNLPQQNAISERLSRHRIKVLTS